MKVAQAEDKGIRLTIHQDELANSPRTEWDNLGTMVCFHKRYNLGDKHDFSAPDDFREYLVGAKVVVLPLYLYDHSGITISTSDTYPFNDRWDAGQVGWIYCTLDKIHGEFGGSVKHITKAIREKVERILKGEVEVYDQYLRGDVYGYTLEKITHCSECGDEHQEDIDSCWGFYGSDWKENGMIDNVGKEYEYLFEKLEDC